MGCCIKATLTAVLLSLAGCAEVDNVQMPENPAPMPEHGPTAVEDEEMVPPPPPA